MRQPTDREPVVAGTFYESDPDGLKGHLKQLFAAGREQPMVYNDLHHSVAAILGPHAGYVFSGEVAAATFAQVPADKPFEHVFLIGTSHRATFSGASVFTRGDFSTPLGRVPVDIQVGKSLAESSPYFNEDSSPHLEEHSLEVQLPFLQYHLRHPFMLVPIILGTRKPEECREVAEALRPWFNENNLFVISTDFSHYPSYEDARRVDQRTLSAILENDPGRLQEVLDENRQLNIPGLATSLCGWSAVLTLLHLTARLEISYKQVVYRNSGDSAYGDHRQVVGYQGVVALRKKEGFSGDALFLSEADKRWLLQRARQSITAAVKNREMPPAGEVPTALTRQGGVFVTLYVEGQLRGCIGCFEGEKPLWECVEQMAASAALNDHRFSPLTAHELNELTVELSVLTPKREITNVSQIELGKHGIEVEHDGKSGMFLPQVPVRYGWDLETFLGRCARDKANLGYEDWEKAKIKVFEAIVFRDGL